MNIQFGRYVEVEIRDFDNQVKTVIGNEFEIEFDYFKTLDQTKEDDSGTIRIYGLTPETIKSLQFEGGEVTLSCGYLKSEISILFIANIARLYYDNSENTTVTTIECSANLMDYYYTGILSSQNSGKSSLEALLHQAATSLGSRGINFSLENIPEDKQNQVKEFIQTFAVNISQVGSGDILLRHLSEAVGLSYNFDKVYNSKSIEFSITDVGKNKILRTIENGYPKIKEITESDKDNDFFFKTLKESDESNKVVLLDFETGLISKKTEYKIAYANADQALNSNEEETSASIEKRNKKAEKQSIRDAKEAKKKAKAEADGKPYKPPKAKNVKEEFLQVNRRYNRVKALLNPLVKPQSAVAIVNEFVPTEDSGIPEGSLSYDNYRVRSATYKGNNKGGEWIMDLYCEDTEANTVTKEDIEELYSRTSPEDFIIENPYEDELGYEE